VASDGLWDYVPIKTIQKIVKEEVEADDIALRLIKAAIVEGSYDNISVIVVRL
jgi:serine/threonine protein phosphatase PrpC